MSNLPVRKRILGIDFGQARIGIAISDELWLLAHPLETVPAGPKSAKRIAAIALEKDVEQVVIGLPRHMNGSIGEAAQEVLLFTEYLRKLLPCEVVTWDERLSTLAANRVFRESGRKTHKTRQFVDQVAAQLILQGYLDSLKRDRHPVESQ